ncbi:hypothetical protein AAG570_005539 [Ranatra chinensis]|uniref:Uncharacterized protein n=1 Tax=Ranatra chinensis TaxID=642074 RepID=A0ABD0YG41_9HEMI
MNYDRDNTAEDGVECDGSKFEECDPGDVPRNVLDKMVAMYCHRDANDDDENDRHGSDTSDESPPLDSPRVNKRRNTKENRSKSDEVKYAAYEVPDPTEDELSETSIVGEHK